MQLKALLQNIIQDVRLCFRHFKLSRYIKCIIQGDGGVYILVIEFFYKSHKVIIKVLWIMIYFW